MDYRLIEDHPAIGVKGQLFDTDQYKAVHHYNRPLFEPVTEDYFLPYRIEITTPHRTVRYMYESTLDVEHLLSHLTNIDRWVLMGIYTAAQEKRPYKYKGNQLTLTLKVYEPN